MDTDSFVDSDSVTPVLKRTAVKFDTTADSRKSKTLQQHMHRCSSIADERVCSNYTDLSYAPFGLKNTDSEAADKTVENLKMITSHLNKRMDRCAIPHGFVLDPHYFVTHHPGALGESLSNTTVLGDSISSCLFEEQTDIPHLTGTVGLDRFGRQVNSIEEKNSKERASLSHADKCSAETVMQQVNELNDQLQTKAENVHMKHKRPYHTAMEIPFDALACFPLLFPPTCVPATMLNNASLPELHEKAPWITTNKIYDPSFPQDPMQTSTVPAIFMCPTAAPLDAYRNFPFMPTHFGNQPIVSFPVDLNQPPTPITISEELSTTKIPRFSCITDGSVYSNIPDVIASLPKPSLSKGNKEVDTGTIPCYVPKGLPECETDFPALQRSSTALSIHKDSLNDNKLVCYNRSGYPLVSVNSNSAPETANINVNEQNYLTALEPSETPVDLSLRSKQSSTSRSISKRPSSRSNHSFEHVLTRRLTEKASRSFEIGQLCPELLNRSNDEKIEHEERIEEQSLCPDNVHSPLVKFDQSSRLTAEPAPLRRFLSDKPMDARPVGSDNTGNCSFGAYDPTAMEIPTDDSMATDSPWDDQVKPSHSRVHLENVRSMGILPFKKHSHFKEDKDDQAWNIQTYLATMRDVSQKPHLSHTERASVHPFGNTLRENIRCPIYPNLKSLIESWKETNYVEDPQHTSKSIDSHQAKNKFSIVHMAKM
ncbi:unnamed protein product [Dicrocoelium dendriticum]|nr:unnamed protein product [Dicrocoelium dendriticum]